MDKPPINVLIVEDSPVIRLLLTHALGADPGLRVVGTAADGVAALEFLSRERPDVVLMDVHMPKMDGFDATRRIMETQPLPIVICSATMKREEVDTTFRALEAGALAFVEKPSGIGTPGFDATLKTLVQSIKAMAEVKVVRRRPGGRPAPGSARVQPDGADAQVQLVAIGASTGGPPVIGRILTDLPRGLSVPILIVQHIAAGFLDGMVDWLGRATGLPVHMAGHGVQAAPGHVYLAPDGCHLGVLPGGRMALSQDPPEGGLRPAVSYLFRSVAGAFGARAAGVLLSGMGRDGAEALRLLRERGALTIAQDAATSVVHGMPGAAIELGAARHVLPPDGIAALLAPLVCRRPAGPAPQA